MQLYMKVFLHKRETVVAGLTYSFRLRPAQVYFNISIGLRSCPDDGEDEDVQVTVHPVGYNESTVVRIHSKCRCSCGPTRRCHDDEQAPCKETPYGSTQEQRPDYGLIKDWNCKAEGSDLDCTGRGVCECGRCVCEQSRLGNVYGKHCEMDDFSCPYEGGLLCGGELDQISYYQVHLAQRHTQENHSR